MKIAKLVFSLIVGLGAMTVANATTIHLGNVDDESRNFGVFTPKNAAFKDFVRFRIGETSAVNFSFQSFYHIVASSFHVKLQEKESGGWNAVTLGSPSFIDLTTGTYRWVVTGLTGKQGGFWTGQMSVAAVPEADVWMMLLTGVGLIGYQLRRKQQSIKHQPFTA